MIAFLQALEAAPDIEPHSLMLVRRGAVVAEGWWAPYAADLPHLLYSLSKSFTSTALGFAVAENLVNLDDPVLSYFPELAAAVTDPRSRSILVRHVAAMASGHLTDTVERAIARDPLDMVRGFLLIPPDQEPGSVFAYNQPCTFTLAAIVQRVTGGSLTDYLRPRLFDPLGIGATGWIRDASGREIGYSGLHATTEAVARLGQLYLQGGRWDGEQLLPADWVAQATAHHVATSLEINPDWAQGYGFQFWMARHGYRGDGAYGQFCVVLPYQDAVLAMTAQTENMQGVLNLAWTHLLPALVDRIDEPADEDAELTARLASLGLPAAPGSPPPAGTVGQSFRAATGNDHPTLTEVVLTAEPAGAWFITLVEGDQGLLAAVGFGKWLVTDAVAASGGWLTPDNGDRWTIGIDVAFIQTPHRLHLRFDPAAGTFESRWMTTPLHTGSLTQLRMPRPT